MPSTTTNLCQAKASYKKITGLLELTRTHLQWTATGKQSPDLRIPNNQASSLFCSKEGAPQVRLKLALVGNEAGHMFTFIATPESAATADRENFKRELTLIISNNRATGSAPAPPTAINTPKTPATPLLAPAASRATSVSSNGRAASSNPSGPADDFQVRKRVLVKNPELAALHRDLVMTSQISEAEFWEGREHLLLAEAAQDSQRRGRSGQLVDPRPQTVEGGDVKIVVTPQLVHDIFEEYPVVAKAYNETVPNQLSEQDFWRRYFQSKLFNSHRASIRSTATQHVVKEDPIFDRYVEKDDDGLEPRRQRDDAVDIFVNLLATQEDHSETGNAKDLTMQAGRQRGALPLIRKFNEHSERVLNASEGTAPKKRRIDDGGREELYSQIDLDDLHDPDAASGITLEMQDRDRYFEGGGGSTRSTQESLPAFLEVLPVFKNQLDGWSSELNRFRLEKKAGEAAVSSMTQNVQARLDVKMRKNDIPDNIFQQMRTCQTAANEFLRQFWSAIYPPPSELQTLAQNTPAQKAAKAAKMASYLAKTPEKVSAIIQAARVSGIDATKIEVALKPVLVAVEKALEYQRSRKTR